MKNIIKYIYYKVKFNKSKILSRRLGGKIKLGYKTAIYKNVIYNNSEMDNYSYINENSLVINTRIGKFTSIGYNCGIGLPEHPINYISTSPFIYSENNIFNLPKTFDSFTKDTQIGNDCWIGNNVIILQGKTIGDGAIIAAGSVVTKDVEPYSIVAGVPAKKIKYRFSENEIKFLNQLKWWDWPIHLLKEHQKMFLSKDKWFEEIKGV